LRLQITGVLSVGFVVAYWRGFAMLDTFSFVPLACLSAILVVPILIDDQALRLWAAVTRALLLMLAIVLVSLISLNLLLWQGEALLPSWRTLAAAAALSPALTVFVAALISLALRRIPRNVVKWAFRLLLLNAILLLRWMPELIDFSMERVIALGVLQTAFVSVAVLGLLSAALISVHE
jgi:hypothetical protein